MAETLNTNTDNLTIQDQSILELEKLLSSTQITIEEGVGIQKKHSHEKQNHLEYSRQQIDPRLSEKQLNDFKSWNLDISHFSASSLKILIANNFKWKDKDLLNTIKKWSLDSKIWSHLLDIGDKTNDPLLKKLSAKYISLQIQIKARKITISWKEYFAVAKKHYFWNEKRLFETKLWSDFISYSDKVLKAKIIEEFKQIEAKIQKELKQLEQSSKWEIWLLRQKHFKNTMVIHEPTADIMKIQRRTLKQKYDIEKTFAKEYIKTTILLSDDPKTLKIEKQAYWNIDFRNWNWSKSNPNADDMLRDSFSEQFQDNIGKMWGDFQKDPLVWIFDVAKIIWAWAVAWATTVLTWWNPIAWWVAFTASDNAIWYVWHWVIWANRWEGFIESWNKAIWLYELDENGEIIRKNWEPAFKKWGIIAVEKFWEVAMWIILMWPISKIWWSVAEGFARRWYNSVISWSIGLWTEALTFNSLNVPFNSAMSWVSTVVDTWSQEKWNQAFESSIRQSISPINFLSSYIHNVAFIGALRAWNKLGWERIWKKMQSMAIESRYNLLTKNYKSSLQDLNIEMNALWFWVVKDWTWYKLVNWEWKTLDKIPESLEKKNWELLKLQHEISKISWEDKQASEDIYVRSENESKRIESELKTGKYPLNTEILEEWKRILKSINTESLNISELSELKMVLFWLMPSIWATHYPKVVKLIAKNKDIFWDRLIIINNWHGNEIINIKAAQKVISENPYVFPNEAVLDTKNWIMNNSRDIFPKWLDDLIGNKRYWLLSWFPKDSVDKYVEWHTLRKKYTKEFDYISDNIINKHLTIENKRIEIKALLEWKYSYIEDRFKQLLLEYDLEVLGAVIFGEADALYMKNMKMFERNLISDIYQSNNNLFLSNLIEKYQQNKPRVFTNEWGGANIDLLNFGAGRLIAE
ncbi:MAG: hypothetical protein ACD_2C00073G0002 [uncultured bacterium (gcode 4)]|uniref:Uncharacterized protein n=1 Tax=uncultured bacterium (gcode 4) TaxID=1234023 RepID=K2GHH8_9BACT|nr:MAG: hypothetical protein ACD_2C00073G0002 [uncultured bacterium (gcode 4)]